MLKCVWSTSLHLTLSQDSSSVETQNWGREVSAPADSLDSLPSTGFQPQLLPVLWALCFLNCLDVRGSCMYRYPFFWRWSWQRSKTSCALEQETGKAEKAEKSRKQLANLGNLCENAANNMREMQCRNVAMPSR